MAHTPTVAFVGIDPTDNLRQYTLGKIGAVLSADVRACRIVLEAENHAHAGARFRAKVELDLPRATIVVGSRGEAFGDLYAAIDDAADDAKRSLRERHRRVREQKRAV